MNEPDSDWMKTYSVQNFNNLYMQYSANKTSDVTYYYIEYTLHSEE